MFMLEIVFISEKLQRTGLECCKRLGTNLSPSYIFNVFSYMILQFKLKEA